MHFILHFSNAENSLQSQALPSQSLVEAHLDIAESLLVEGAYRSAYLYLKKLGSKFNLSDRSRECTDWLDKFLRRREVSDLHHPVFSGSLVVRYEICRASYYYLLDLGSEDAQSDYRWETQKDESLRSLIRNYAWQALNHAEGHIKVRLAKYSIINEFSQATFSPHYRLLAQICFIRAKMMIFLPRLVPKSRLTDKKSPGYLPFDVCDSGGSNAEHSNPHSITANQLYLLEKARIYAGSDGDAVMYSRYTAYQCWVYTMAAFLQNPRAEESSGNGRLLCESIQNNLNLNLSREECMSYARRLRNHALASYSATGRAAYYQIKEKSGLIHNDGDNQYQWFEDYGITYIPTMQETFQEKDAGFEPGKPFGVLKLNMKPQAIRRKSIEAAGDPEDIIYLFGPNACYLFFARGAYHLCSDYVQEFHSEDPDEEKVTTIEEWKNKLEKAYQLFSYAWAIADDGCDISTSDLTLVDDQNASEVEALRIRRQFKEKLNSMAEVYSVRELYPRRVTEIADLGRIYAAACRALFYI